MKTCDDYVRSRSRMPLIVGVAATLLGCLCTGAWLTVAAVRAADVKADAPPGQVVLRHTPGGAYFVAAPLKKEYDRLLAQVQALQADLDADRATGPDVLAELKDLQARLEKLRTEIDQKKVLVSPLKVHTQVEEMTFDLGPERLLVITADRVRVLGWEGPQIKCVLEKTVLAPGDQPADEHLRGLKIVHHLGPAPGIVGKSQAERDADEQKFLATEDGRKMTDAARKGRNDLLREIAAAHAPYAAFQGKAIDTVEIDGLTFEQGNRQVGVEIRSPGGGASSGSDWQRRAALTVYVPACKALAVRGCQGSLEVRGVSAPLVLTNDGSHDRDYDDTFVVRDLAGPLTAVNVPLDLVDGVRGDVTLNCTTEMVNTGTVHDAARGDRTLYTPPPRALTCRNIDGGLTAWFTRSDLKVEKVSGRLDVRNEFGNTAVTLADPLADKAHRILSESGRIEVRLSANSLGNLPLQALTNCGTVRTDAPEDVLEDTSFMLGRDHGGASRDWRGVKSVRKGGAAGGGDFFAATDRLAAVLEGRDRSPGLDLISRCGVVRVTYEP
jgi:hypothetical protein